MNLSRLLKRLKCYRIFGKNDINIENLSQNSKKTVKNTLFFCINGTKTNGIVYVKEAIDNGSVAIVTDKKLNINITQIIVKDVRKAMAIIASNFYNNPEKKLKIVGITGTNGKTSTSLLIYQLLKHLNKKVGVIGTSGIWIDNKKFEASMTTPDSIELFELFAKMVENKVEYCIMEVSAHAIYFNKIFGIKFKVKVLTNVKSDHLDFFKTNRKYIKTKQSFFDTKSLCVLNLDDKIGKNIAKNHKKSLNFGSKNANFLIFNKKCELGCTNFDLKFKKKIYHIKTNFTGVFNVYNTVCAIATIYALGLKINDVVKLISKINNIDGRLDCVNYGQNFPIIIDYAHTFDALKNLLVTIKKVSKNKNIIVFGCPGERDTKKRFKMGKIAGQFCDCVIVTADNPASENPKRIMFEIGSGVRETKTKCYFAEDRKNAIRKAINIVKNKTYYNILIVGKGTEQYQIVGDKHKIYSDYDTVKELVQNTFFVKNNFI